MPIGRTVSGTHRSAAILGLEEFANYVVTVRAIYPAGPSTMISGLVTTLSAG